MAKNPTRSLVTPEFRFSYPSLILPRPFTDPKTGKPTGKEAYQVEALFPEASLSAFKMYDEAQNKYIDVSLPHVLVQLAQEAWPSMVFPEGHPSAGQPMSVKQLFEVQLNKGWPIQRGEAVKRKRETNAKAKGKGFNGDHYDGQIVISLHSNKADNVQPPVLSRVTGAKTFKVLERVNDVDMGQAKLLFQGGNYGFATISIVAQVVSGVHFLTPYLNGIRYTREGKKFGGQSEMDRFDGINGGASAHNPTAGMDEEIPY